MACLHFMYSYYLASLLRLITNNTAIRSIRVIGVAISTILFPYKYPRIPAIIYPTADTAATVMTYGNCVETWFTWSEWAPADAMIVVSEIGEQ